MSDPLNTIGFCSWGLLGSGEEEGETIYILDLAVDAAMDEVTVSADFQNFEIGVSLDEPDVILEVEEDVVDVEIKSDN